MRGVVQCFLNVNMGLGHDGLKAIAEKYKVKPETLEAGEYLVFINRKQEKIKVMAKSSGVLVFAYARYPSRINLNAIQYIPHAFQGGTLNFDKALEMALTQTLNQSLLKGPSQPVRGLRRTALNSEPSSMKKA